MRGDSTEIVRSLAAEAVTWAEWQHVVYFLHAPVTGLVKIGYSFCLRNRMVELQAMSPARLDLLGVMAGDQSLEVELHRRFCHLRSHGEWFRLDEDLAEFINLQTLIYRWNRASPRAREKFLELANESVLDDIDP